ncbi:hypothetical protein TNCV_4918381 [Trichonephila clavipes]|nr:hypothetical protein TNCV_4918381 [Trichonephila clavipes]
MATDVATLNLEKSNYKRIFSNISEKLQNNERKRVQKKAKTFPRPKSEMMYPAAIKVSPAFAGSNHDQSQQRLLPANSGSSGRYTPPGRRLL